MTTEPQEREKFEAWIKTTKGYPFARQFANLMWLTWQARAALAAQPQAIATGVHTDWHAPVGDVVITTKDGQCVAVTRQDEDGRILSVIWEAQPQAAQPVQDELTDQAIENLAMANGILKSQEHWGVRYYTNTCANWTWPEVAALSIAVAGFVAIFGILAYVRTHESDE